MTYNKANLAEKEVQLKKIISQYKKAIVSFSGGVDSTLVAYYAESLLGKNAFITIGDSPSLARDDLGLAKKIADDFNFNLILLYPEEFKNPAYLKNPVNRCYFCKQDLYKELAKLKKKVRAEVIMDGTNFDDAKELRPGLKAAKKKNVLHPLLLAKLTKKEIRILAQKNNLPNYNKFASPCLASRIPHGQVVNREKIKQIEKAEKFLREKYNITPLRVRHHLSRAQIETNQANAIILHQVKDEVKEFFLELGFSQVNWLVKKVRV